MRELMQRIWVRYQGGSNAGHTVIVGQEHYVFHLLPSAILREDKVCVIGNGVVVDPKALLDENPDPDEPAVRRALDGNLCRCTGYVKQVEAALLAAKKLQADRGGR